MFDLQSHALSKNVILLYVKLFTLILGDRELSKKLYFHTDLGEISNFGDCIHVNPTQP